MDKQIPLPARGSERNALSKARQKLQSDKKKLDPSVRWDDEPKATSKALLEGAGRGWASNLSLPARGSERNALSKARQKLQSDKKKLDPSVRWDDEPKATSKALLEGAGRGWASNLSLPARGSERNALSKVRQKLQSDMKKLDPSVRWDDEPKATSKALLEGAGRGWASNLSLPARGSERNALSKARQKLQSDKKKLDPSVRWDDEQWQDQELDPGLRRDDKPKKD
ncbi:hypothetical protein [Tahibacter soli]|uniref:Uncharacterized protein n=1 Tax=Tahibacter soli TaxID=2983605 RepID=A0A9X3YNW1_9GAMM|nr:hypothetical protein [Tahibacter soli]MDC8015699.1 hypothetical protein [Tahibacter soli]